MYKTILIGMIALGLLSSCTEHVSTYRVRVLERNTIGIMYENQKGLFSVGDTVWLNLSTNRVDNASDTTMLAVIEKQIN